jgi:NADH dehydrogenase
VFVIGDLASATDAAGKPLPGLAPVATQQGRFVAATIRGDARGTPRGRFDYVDRGSMATIGSSLAIAQVKGFHFSGFIAWILWVFIHLIFLVDYRNRGVVLVTWAWRWVAADRSARLLWQGERGDVGPR